MTKRRKSSRKPGSHRGSRPARSQVATAEASELTERSPASANPAADQALEPRFWFGFEVPWTKLVVFRVCLFGVLALDSVLQLETASRYGSGFNVAHVSWLGALAPGRSGFILGELTTSYLLALAAFGIATRWTVPAAAALYSWLYFTSQADSYQHHYLVALLLFVASFVPWQRSDRAITTVRSWALRLMLVVLAIVYLWAAISKLDGAWLDGRTLARQLAGVTRSMIESTIGFSAASVVIVVCELVLAATIWLRPTWRVAAPLGIALHVGILLSHLEIGLFAVLMLAIYVVVLPDRWFRWQVPVPAFAMRPSWSALVIAIIVGGVAGWRTGLPLAFAGSLIAAAVALVLTARRRPLQWLAVAHLSTVVGWWVVDETTHTARDYYKFLGGAHRRLATSTLSSEAERQQHRAVARDAYRELVAIAPTDASAHYQYGRLLLADGDHAGLDQLRAAQRLEPNQARAFTEAARYLARIGRRAEALEAARAAVAAEPGNQDARAVLDSLRTRDERPVPRGDSDEP